jgi:hypothetical protein
VQYRVVLAVLVCCMLVFTGGCDSSSGPKVHPVNGKLTIGGKPPSGVTITFHPVDASGEAASGRVDEQGNFKLYSGNQGREGAAAGKYKVVLTQTSAGTESGNYMKAEKKSGARSSSSGPGVPGMPAATFPKEYMSATTSPKEVEVTSGTNEITIEI